MDRSSDSTFELRGALRWLRAALVNLASSASEQIAYLIDLGTYPSTDELALDYENFATQIDDLEEAGFVSSIAAATMRQLSKELDTISGEVHAALWTPKALQSASEWAEIRQLARQALELLEPTPNVHT